MRFLASALGAILSLFLLGGAVYVGAQEGEEATCEFVEFRTLVRGPGGGGLMNFSHPVIECDNGVRMSADSAVHFETDAFTRMFGNVFFEDPETRLTADSANYASRQDRLFAWGHAVLTNRVDGAVIQGDTLTLLRGGNLRPQNRITVRGNRPHARIFPTVPDSAGGGEARDYKPYEVDADEIFLDGPDYFRATGNVRIQRGSLDARGEVAEFDQVAGRLILQDSARILGRTYDLTGRTIIMRLVDGEADMVTARGEAEVRGDDLRLTSREIRLCLVEGRLERLIARRHVDEPPSACVQEDPPEAEEEGGEGAEKDPPTLEEQRQEARRTRVFQAKGAGPPESVRATSSDAPPADTAQRAVAVADNFYLEGDSIEVIAPDEQLQKVVAVGRARGQTEGPDSLVTEDTPEIARADWLEGEIVTAHFIPRTDSTGAPLVPADSTQSRFILETLTAERGARSLYRLPPNDSTAMEPGFFAIHYVEGDRIVISMKDGEVENMNVEGQTYGIYNDPIRPSPPLGDSTIVDGGRVRGGGRR